MKLSEQLDYELRRYGQITIKYLFDGRPTYYAEIPVMRGVVSGTGATAFSAIFAALVDLKVPLKKEPHND